MPNITIAVVGASGKSGRAFVKAALEAGYRIRAGVRSRQIDPAPNLEIIRCDATNPQEVAALIEGCEVVVSLLGHVRHSAPDMQTMAIKVIIEQMQKQGLRRLLSLTGTGVRRPLDTPSFIDKVANKAITLIDPQRIHDGIQHAAIIEHSPLDWTVLRVLKLTDGHAGSFTLSEHGPAKSFTSREEVAQAILEILADDRWIRTFPIVSTANR